MEDPITLGIEHGTFAMKSQEGRRHFVRIYYEGAQLEVFVGTTVTDVKTQASEYLSQLALAVAEAQADVRKIPADQPSPESERQMTLTDLEAELLNALFELVHQSHPPVGSDVETDNYLLTKYNQAVSTALTVISKAEKAERASSDKARDMRTEGPPLTIEFSFHEAAEVAAKLANEIEDYEGKVTKDLSSAFCKVMRALIDSGHPFFETTLMLKYANIFMPKG